MPSLVIAWVEAGTGRLIRAEVKTRDARLGVMAFDPVRVEFKFDEKLGMLVPVRDEGIFLAGRFRDGTGTARYSNYRRFRTASRMVPPPP